MSPIFRSASIWGAVLVLAASCGTSSPAQPSATPKDSFATVSAACASEPLRTTGAVYYFCDCQPGRADGCVPGSDSNSGTSADSPWQSIGKAAQTFATMPAGSTVALCRGGRWNDVPYRLNWDNQSCRAASTCDLRDYTPDWADAATPRPVLQMVKQPPGANDQDSTFWLQRSVHLEGLRFLNFELRAQQEGWGFFVANSKDDVEICNLRLDGFALPFHLAGGGHNYRVRVHGNEILNATGQGFLGSSEDGELSYNRWDHCGRGDMFGHTIYAANESAPDFSYLTTSNFHVIGNEITRSSHDATGACAGVVIVVHGQFQGLVIEGNVIDEEKAAGGCYGIGVGTNGSGHENHFIDTAIRGNVVKNVGYVSVDLNTTQETLVENNRVEVSFPGGVAIRAPGQPKEAASPANTGTVIRNNTLYFTPPANEYSTPVVGIQAGVEGSGYVVASNAIYYTGSQSGIWCLRLDGGASFAVVDANLCAAGSGAFSWGSWNGTVYPSLAEWQAATGFDAQSVNADPAFTSGADFTPAAGSPLVGAASAIQHASTDFTGKPRDASPDIGAYER